MGRFISAKNSMKHTSALKLGRKLKTQKVLCEALEQRQLMSLTIEVRGTDGSSSATVSSVGQVINLELIAVISDATHTPTQDGLQDVVGNILSSAVQGHAVAGNLAAATINPFKAFGSEAGTQQDINGDGNIDVGNPSSSSSVGTFIARSSTLQTSANGTIVGNTLTYEIGTLTYTVTNLNKGGSTNINFAPYVSGVPDAAGWLEDNQETDNTNGVFQAGSAYTVSDPALIVPPVAVNDSATATRNTALTIDELANDDKVVALNPASVTIVTNVAHGSTAIQANGSVIYTPATGYTGTDSFTYHVADTDGRVSNTATVNINVVLAPAPIATAVTSSTLRNQAVTINLASQDTATSPATITPTSIAIVTAPTNGTAVVQSDGTVVYTPHSGFVGTDTFTYTVTDSNVETSNPGTVTISIDTPTPPTAANDAFTTTEGAPLSLNVLGNDRQGSVAIDPTTVDIDTVPLHGTAVPEADGTVLYTPTGGYIGDDSFTYSVSDTLGEVSNVAVVNLSINHGVPPVAADFSATALTGQATAINVVANVVSGATLTPSTLTTSAPSHGTVTVNTDGTVSYTPTPGFVGADSFTYSVGNVNGDSSNTATANVFVGTAISKAKGATHTVAFTDLAGGLQTISLNVGVADIFFTGTGTIAVAKNGAATVTGGTVDIQNLTLTGTTAASSLTIKGLVAKPVDINAITDTAPLGKLTAASASLQGPATFDGLGALQLASMNNAGITVGSGVARMSMTVGAASSSSLTSDVPITTLKLGSWTNSTQGNAISAPSIASLVDAGAFQVGLALSLATSRALALGSAKIGGVVDGSFTTTSVGNIGTLSFGSVAGTWAPTVNNIKSLTIKSGGLASQLVAGVIGSLLITGDLTGGIAATSANVIKVNGVISGSSMTFTGAGGLKTLSATGAITNEAITSTGNIGAITAGSMTGSTISAGIVSGTTFANSTAATLGSGIISSIKVVGKTPTFASTNILASKISSASLGVVTADNGGAAFGLATKSINSFAGTFANGPAHIGHTQLLNDAVLSTYLTQQSIVFGDFAINIES